MNLQSGRPIFVIKRFVGVDELGGNELRVYPTPTNDIVTIAIAGNFSFEITALNGEIIAKGSAVDKKEVDLQKFAAGTYLVNVIIEGKTTTLRVVKN